MTQSPQTDTRLPAAIRRAGIVLSGVFLVILTTLLLMPGGGEPGPIPHLDKVFHALGFFGLVLPLATVLPRHALSVALAATLFGGAIELIQPGFGRGAEWGDALANLLGAFAAALAGRALHPWLARKLAAPNSPERRQSAGRGSMRL